MAILGENQAVEVVDTFGFLLGTWDLHRSIQDHGSRISGSFHGIAAVAPVESEPSPNKDARASYDETGKLRFGTHIGHACRHLQYMNRLGSNVVTTFFVDGRPFVDLDLRSGKWRSVHNCGADRYELTTIVRSHRIVEEHWRVRGPSESYDAVAILMRQ